MYQCGLAVIGICNLPTFLFILPCGLVRTEGNRCEKIQRFRARCTKRTKTQVLHTCGVFSPFYAKGFTLTRTIDERNVRARSSKETYCAFQFFDNCLPLYLTTQPFQTSYERRPKIFLERSVTDHVEWLKKRKKKK